MEGWLLVVPRTRTLSYAQLPAELWPEAEAFTLDVASRVEREYGPVAIFEHGPGREESLVGCGVDYAHLHVVPTGHDLRAAALREFPSITWNAHNRITDIRQLRGRRLGYWALWQPEHSHNWWIGTTEREQTSQLFRRLLAKSVNLPDPAADWKHDVGEELISATVERLTCAVAAHD